MIGAVGHADSGPWAEYGRHLLEGEFRGEVVGYTHDPLAGFGVFLTAVATTDPSGLGLMDRLVPTWAETWTCPSLAQRTHSELRPCLTVMGNRPLLEQLADFGRPRRELKLCPLCGVAEHLIERRISVSEYLTFGVGSGSATNSAVYALPLRFALVDSVGVQHFFELMAYITLVDGHCTLCRRGTVMWLRIDDYPRHHC
jgi:hypothetical protein